MFYKLFWRESEGIFLLKDQINCFKSIVFFSKLLSLLYLCTYRREQKSNHPSSKALQWLAWYTEFWAGQGWSYILLCWGCSLYMPWDYVCMLIFKKKSSRWFLRFQPNGYWLFQYIRACTTTRKFNFRSRQILSLLPYLTNLEPKVILSSFIISTFATSTVNLVPKNNVTANFSKKPYQINHTYYP